MGIRAYSQNQTLLFPPDIRQLLPDDHPAVIISDIVDKMDLSILTNKISDEGRSAYHPRMMLKILIYAYSIGIFSSRKIHQALRESIAFIFLAAWQKPDFRTIADFRKNNLPQLKTLFALVIEYCSRMEMVSLGHISIDGTKIKANAADRRTFSKERIEKKIKELLEQANQTDSDEDSLLGPNKAGDEVPEHIQKQSDRLKILQKIKDEVEKGQKININTTDPDAGFMKTTRGITTAFNAQIAVDEKNQVIVAADVTTDPADVAQLIPMVEQVESNVGKPEIVSADAGYSSGENLNSIEVKEIDGYIPDPEYQGNQRRPIKEVFFHRSRFARDETEDCFVCPAGQKLPFSYNQKTKNDQILRIYRCNASECPMKDQCTKNSQGRTISLSPYARQLEKMHEKLQSEEGKRVYKKRQVIVEPVFATLKRAMGFSRFLLRGINKVRGEFTLLCIAHNMRKIVGAIQSGVACPQIS
jgi:transposase